MDNLIVDTVLKYLPKKNHRAPSGWISFSGPCCVHNGESKDIRGRAGIIVNGPNFSYACFNCKYKTGYRVGNKFGYKLQKLLEWWGVDDKEISMLKIDALRAATDINGIVVYEKEKIPVSKIDLPRNSFLLSEVEKDYPEHADYIRSRGFELTDYPFFVSKYPLANMPNRVILPFVRENTIVGYTARAINNIKPKYYMQLTCPYVFGIDLQQHDWTWTILSEGPFDALSVNGLSPLGNEVSEQQATIIDELGTRVIVVPQADEASDYLIEAALRYNWEVAFPEWESDIKDLNEAVQKYGQLLVTKHILQTVCKNKTKIRLLKKFR